MTTAANGVASAPTSGNGVAGLQPEEYNPMPQVLPEGDNATPLEVIGELVDVCSWERAIHLFYD